MGREAGGRVSGEGGGQVGREGKWEGGGREGGEWGGSCRVEREVVSGEGGEVGG